MAPWPLNVNVGEKVRGEQSVFISAVNDQMGYLTVAIDVLPNDIDLSPKIQQTILEKRQNRVKLFVPIRDMSFYSKVDMMAIMCAIAPQEVCRLKTEIKAKANCLSQYATCLFIVRLI